MKERKEKWDEVETLSRTGQFSISISLLDSNIMNYNRLELERT